MDEDETCWEIRGIEERNNIRRVTGEVRNQLGPYGERVRSVIDSVTLWETGAHSESPSVAA